MSFTFCCPKIHAFIEDFQSNLNSSDHNHCIGWFKDPHPNPLPPLRWRGRIGAIDNSKETYEDYILQRPYTHSLVLYSETLQDAYN